LLLIKSKQVILRKNSNNNQIFRGYDAPTPGWFPSLACYQKLLSAGGNSIKNKWLQTDLSVRCLHEIDIVCLKSLKRRGYGCIFRKKWGEDISPFNCYALIHRKSAWADEVKERNMTKHMPPREHDWYRDEAGTLMQVTLFDQDKATVEVQLFDGAITEYDLAFWNQLELQAIDPPEDWSGPFDDLVADDMGNTEKPRHPTDWNGPADEMEKED